MEAYRSRADAEAVQVGLGRLVESMLVSFPSVLLSHGDQLWETFLTEQVIQRMLAIVILFMMKLIKEKKSSSVLG